MAPKKSQKNDKKCEEEKKKVEKNEEKNEKPEVKKRKSDDMTSSTIRRNVAELSSHMVDSWSLVARVICKNHVKYWKSFSNSGRLFDFFLLDRKGDGIRGIVFNEGIDRYENLIQSGQIYEFSNCRIKNVKRQFLVDDAASIELSFNSDSTICKIDDDGFGEDDNTKYTCINDISSCDPGKRINVIGVVTDFNSATEITTKAGKNVMKRDFFLVDGSCKKVLCTAWGQVAEDGFDGYKNRVVMIRSGSVNEYNGRKSISLGAGSVLFHDIGLQQAKVLVKWYDTVNVKDIHEIECNGTTVGGIDRKSFEKKDIVKNDG